jgi:alpha-L-fucosidase 2
LLKYVSPDNYRGEDYRGGGGTYPNLLDAHSPFQIDGNFGGCAGVAEMLMQSTEKTITLLPALPDEWATGEVRGLCARGGFEVDMSWSQGKVVRCTIRSKRGGTTTVSYNGTSKTVKLKAGGSNTLL